MERNPTLDVAKGFAITLVVFGHVLRALLAEGALPPETHWPFWLNYLIYTFHMPLFFFISGFLVSRNPRGLYDALPHLLTRIVYPYFLWSLLQGSVKIVFSRFTTHPLQPSDLTKILWIPIPPFWFLYALFLCYVIYLSLRRLFQRLGILRHFDTAMLTMAAVAFAVVFRIYHGAGPLDVFSATARGLFYFALGPIVFPYIQVRLGRPLAIISTALCVVLAQLWYRSAVDADFAAPAAIFGIIACLYWSRITGWGAAVVSFLGRNSMSIFVMHSFFQVGTRLVLHKTGLRSVPVDLVVDTMFGLTIPLGVHALVTRLGCEQWLGVPPQYPLDLANSSKRVNRSAPTRVWPARGASFILWG